MQRPIRLFPLTAASFVIAPAVRRGFVQAEDQPNRIASRVIALDQPARLSLGETWCDPWRLSFSRRITMAR
jgi:hypothetical protein